MNYLVRAGIALWFAATAVSVSGCESCGFSLSPRRTLLTVPNAVEMLSATYDVSDPSGLSIERADATAWWIVQEATGGLIGSCWYPEFTVRAQSSECTYAPVTVPRAEDAEAQYRVNLVCED